MTYLLTRTNRTLLTTFARSNVLLAFDYDGTLAPLVSTPRRATMRSSTRNLLARASAQYPCVVISGRARRDVLDRLRGIGIHRVVGNHGAEPAPGSETVRRLVQQWLSVLKQRLLVGQGVFVEDKGLSIAIHYRQAKHRLAARRAILTATRSLDHVRVIGGKLAINLLAPSAPHKGLALERERAQFACETAIYVGDDETDEDAFRLARSGRVLSVRVGRKGTSAASYYLRNQAEIDTLLGTLVALRNGDAGRRPRQMRALR